MSTKLKRMLQKDVDEIKEILGESESYNFAEDLQQRMQQFLEKPVQEAEKQSEQQPKKKAGLSSSALARRACVSRPAVDRWLHGEVRPNGKERMKELGMALGMNANELDTFLLINGYPKLYVRNPLDSAAKLLLLNIAGDPDIVKSYRNLVNRLGLDSISLNDGYISLASTIMNVELNEAAKQSTFSNWFREHRRNFTDDERTQLPDMRIARYLSLYIGDSTIHEMQVIRELPAALTDILYSMTLRRSVNTRGLREKIIAFGLYSNMTEEEINILLDHARLRKMSDPASRLDFVVLLALRIAHDRYPYYEYENKVRIIKRLQGSTDEFDQQILNDYSVNFDSLRQMVEYYDRSDVKDLLFERTYTSYSDHGIMDYIRDMLALLKENEILTDEDINPIWDLIQRENGVWG